MATIIAMDRSPKHSPSGEKDMPQGFNTCVEFNQ